jgi:purine-binding chemotaxis protein CheW
MLELLAIRVADLEFALELAAVKEVIRPPALVRVPNLPAFVSGVINFRGVAIPVIDLKSKFQVVPERKGAVDDSPSPDGEKRIAPQRLVICAVRSERTGESARAADKVVAFEVDEASEIVRVPRGAVLPAADGALRSVVAGVVPHRDRLLVWLDAPGLLSSDEKLTLDRFRMRREDLVRP